MVTIRSTNEDNDQIAFKVVVVNGINGDYAAYVGPSDWSDGAIRSSGQKLKSTAGEALAHDLPFLSNQFHYRTYRR